MRCGMGEAGDTGILHTFLTWNPNIYCDFFILTSQQITTGLQLNSKIGKV